MNKDVELFERYGWTIKSFSEESKYAPGSFPDLKEHYELLVKKGKINLEQYINEEIIETGYLFEESVGPFNYVLGYLLESEGKIIGSYLTINQQNLNGSVYEIITGPTIPIANKENVLIQVKSP